MSDSTLSYSMVGICRPLRPLHEDRCVPSMKICDPPMEIAISEDAPIRHVLYVLSTCIGNARYKRLDAPVLIEDAPPDVICLFHFRLGVGVERERERGKGRESE